jgi:hypothetical protein
MDIIDINYFNLKYYNNLNKYLIKNSIDNKHILTYIDKLNNKNNNNKNNNNKNNNKNNEEYKYNTETDSANIVSITSDVNLYKKSWSKLNIIHKTIKIKEFVNNLKINCEKNRDKIKNELISLLKNKVLTKKDKVVYDEERGIIVSLTELEYNNGMYNYKNI